MRALTSLTTMFTLALGLVACGDDGKGTTTLPMTMPTTDPTATEASAGTTTAPGTTTGDTPTTSATTSPTTTGDEASAGTTTDPSDGTTTDPSDGTTTDPSDGTTTDPSDGTTTDPSGTSTGGPGEDLYGPCDAMSMCPAGQLCLMVGMIEGNFCAPDCEGMGCPATPAGVTAQAMCVLTKPMEMDPTSCALICDPKMMGMCPDGMTCKPVPMQTIGLCTAP